MFSGKIIYRSFSSNPDYFVLTEKGVLHAVQDSTQSDFSIGEYIFFDGAVKGNEVFTDSIRLADEDEEKKLECKNEEFLESKCRAHTIEPLVSDLTLKKMLPVFKTAALYVQRKIIEMTPMILRYDSDPDGITSAILFRKAVRDFARQQNIPYPDNFCIAKGAEAPIYEIKHLTADNEIANDFAKKPLLVLLDHGSNAESEHTVKTAKDSGFEMLFVDHHPYSEWTAKHADCFVHALQLGGNSSHCTGLLAWHLAKAINGKADEKLAWYAMQADKSSFAKPEKFKEPIAIDYLSTKETKLNEYEKILADPHLVDLSFQKAMLLKKKALELAVKSCKRITLEKGEILLLDISPFGDKYPPKGGYVQQLHELHEPETKRIVTIGYDSERVIFRANEAANKAGFKANLLIEETKKELPKCISSGGGHERASSMRIKEGFSRIVLEFIVKRTTEILNG